MRLITMTAILALAAGCTREIQVAHTDYDQFTRSHWTSVLAPMDAVGGERQTLLCRSDYYGQLQQCWDGHGIGTGQGFMAGGFAGLMQAGGFAGGMALLRPSQTNVSNNSTTSGGNIAPGAASASAAANPINTASGGVGQGGTGGAGGNAAGGTAAGGTVTATGGVATGGNPTAIASPTVTASPVVSATASPHANATGGNGYGGNSNSAASSVARQNQGQSNTNSNFNGQWNCRNSPPCN